MPLSQEVSRELARAQRTQSASQRFTAAKTVAWNRVWRLRQGVQAEFDRLRPTRPTDYRAIISDMEDQRDRRVASAERALKAARADLAAVQSRGGLAGAWASVTGSRAAEAERLTARVEEHEARVEMIRDTLRTDSVVVHQARRLAAMNARENERDMSRLDSVTDLLDGYSMALEAIDASDPSVVETARSGQEMRVVVDRARIWKALAAGTGPQEENDFYVAGARGDMDADCAVGNPEPAGQAPETEAERRARVLANLRFH